MEKTDRNRKVIEMRESGLSFSAIGKAMGWSTPRARELYLRAKKRASDEQMDGTISDFLKMDTPVATRAFNCLRKIGVGERATRDEVRVVMEQLRIGSKTGKKSIANFGARSLLMIREWLA